jgi:hypothetical protein
VDDPQGSVHKVFHSMCTWLDHAWRACDLIRLVSSVTWL